MNILHMVPALESGGVETGTVDLALSLKKFGRTVVVVSSGGRLVDALERNGITHIKLPVHKKSISALLLVPKIARILKTHKIDIVHASSRVPAWIGFFACKLTGTVFVTSCHGFYSAHLLSRVMGWGKLVMVISKTVGKRMTEAFGVPESRIRLVYRGLDLEDYPYRADKYTQEKDSFIVINIGRLTPIKGQHEFIEAMKHVAGRMKNTEAWIVGGPKEGKGDYPDTLGRLAKELGIEDRVKFLGLRSDIQDLLDKSDCLVLSTNIPEGFGRTVIEAGARGTAVCASGVGGIKEIVEDSVSGLLFPPNDPPAMADAIVRMLSDVELRQKCARNLRAKVEQNFTLDKMARRTLAVYEEALKD
jgi:glycosyltransferase involved in cell wall biosynthesis